MIGQSTVITNQQGGGGGGRRVFKHFTPFCIIACFTTAQARRLGLHVLQQHRHVDWDDRLTIYQLRGFQADF